MISKECVDSAGMVRSQSYFRAAVHPYGPTGWLSRRIRAGLYSDQHIHDVDTINWLFGKPAKVSTIAKNVVPGSGYDIVSTNYI